MVQIKSLHNCKDELREKKLRATPARIAILQLLELTKEPVDVTTIIEHLQKKDIVTDPATVFRVINMFTQRGITIPIQFQEGKTRYELANTKHHHHLFCENCGKIKSVEDVDIPVLEKHIEKKYKFIVKRHSLEFFGLCEDCQK
jgi:Fur family transcriptional regulator, ferric uptake regulator